MATATLEKHTIDEVFKAAKHLLNLPAKQMWTDYDEEADVLYISFKRPQNSTDSEMMENGVLLRYRDKELVGITVLNASKKIK